MSRDLTDALSALTNTSPYGGDLPTPPPARGAAPAAKSSVLLAGGATEGAATPLTVAGARTVLSSDGLFSWYFPYTLDMDDSGTVYSLGVIKKTP